MKHFIKFLLNIKSPSKLIHELEIEEDTELWHHAFIEHLAIILKPKVYVELGIHKCSVINRIIPHVEKAIGVDIDQNSGGFMKKTSKSFFVCSTTLEFAKQLQNNPISIDLLFIDADHACEAVLDDINAYFPFVSSHGIILIHDTHPKNIESMASGFCNDSFKVVDKLARDINNLEFVTIPVHPGLTIVRKRKIQLSWMEIT